MQHSAEYRPEVENDDGMRCGCCVNSLPVRQQLKLQRGGQLDRGDSAEAVAAAAGDGRRHPLLRRVKAFGLQLGYNIEAGFLQQCVTSPFEHL